MSLRPSALGLVLLLAAGCGRQDDGRLEVWAFGREGEVLQEMVPELERRLPGLRLDVQQIPWSAAHEKLLTAVVGEATPDLAQLGSTWVAELVTLEALAPLAQRVAGSHGLAAADYFPGAWQANELDGELWGVPWYVDTRLLFYRSDLLAAAGWARAPETWDEWRQALSAIQRHNGGRSHALLMPIDEWEHTVVLGMEAGSSLLRDGDRYGDFRGAGFRRGFELFLSFYRDGFAPVANLNQVASVYQAIERGEVVFYVTGPWNLGEFARRLPAHLQAHWATAPLPRAEAAAPARPGVSLAGGASLALFRNSKRQEDAWRLVELLADPAVQRRFFELSGNLPPRLSAWQGAPLEGNERAAAFRRQLEVARPVPRVPEWEAIASQIRRASESAARGQQSLDEALARLDADVDRLLAKRRQVLGEERP